MWLPCTAATLLVLALPMCAHRVAAQTSGSSIEGETTFRLRLPVNEVSLTFHAADAHGLPVNNLKADELRLRDNGKPPRRIVDFRLLQDSPIRAGILIDTSESMEQNLAGSRAIAIRYAQRLLRQQSDQAFVMDFGYISKITQAWTSDPAALAIGVHQATAGKENPLGGTTIFDTVFRACLSEFGKIDHATSGNFILLFSDGEDNASHVSLQEAVDRCQRSNTAIYAFRARPNPGSYSTGPKTLRELAEQTGGSLFRSTDSDSEIDGDLHAIEADLRNQYRLVYNPAEIKADGSFHRIDLTGPDRAANISVRSGYYAPVQ
jgi:Ca-activated chloride channel family protein